MEESPVVCLIAISSENRVIWNKRLRGSPSPSAVTKRSRSDFVPDSILAKEPAQKMANGWLRITSLALRASRTWSRRVLDCRLRSARAAWLWRASTHRVTVGVVGMIPVWNPRANLHSTATPYRRRARGVRGRRRSRAGTTAGRVSRWQHVAHVDRKMDSSRAASSGRSVRGAHRRPFARPLHRSPTVGVGRLDVVPDRARPSCGRQCGGGPSGSCRL